MQGFGETHDEHEKNREIFLREVLEKVRALPGVQSAALANVFPMLRTEGYRPPLEIEGRTFAPDEARAITDINYVTPGYFRTVGLPLVRGRLLAESDTADAPLVVLITQSMARRYWECEDPIGKMISTNRGRDWRRVAGVVGDVRQFGPAQPVADVVFQPLQQGGFALRLLVRTQTPPEEMVQTVSRAILGIAPDQTIDRVETLEQFRSDVVAQPRLTTALIAMFAGLALFITLAGISGVLAVGVSERTHEFGIRMALGATPAKVLRLVLGQGLTPVLIGLGLGLVGAIALNRLISGFLYHVEPTDPLTLAGVMLCMFLAAVAACLVPARRATRVEPMVALRYE